MIPTRVERAHAELMRKCWETRVQRRCTMAEAVQKLEFMLGESAVKVDATTVPAAMVPSPPAAAAPAERLTAAGVAPPAATQVDENGSNARRKPPTTGKALKPRVMAFDLRGSLMGRKARAAGAMREQTIDRNDLGVIAEQGETRSGSARPLRRVAE